MKFELKPPNYPSPNGKYYLSVEEDGWFAVVICFIFEQTFLAALAFTLFANPAVVLKLKAEEIFPDWKFRRSIAHKLYKKIGVPLVYATMPLYYLYLIQLSYQKLNNLPFILEYIPLLMIPATLLYMQKSCTECRFYAPTGNRMKDWKQLHQKRRHRDPNTMWWGMTWSLSGESPDQSEDRSDWSLFKRLIW